MSVLQIQKAQERIIAHGYELVFQDYCECAETPGFPGHIRGVTDHKAKRVRISIKANQTPELLADILEHELRHIDEPDWDCGNRDVLGRARMAKSK